MKIAGISVSSGKSKLELAESKFNSAFSVLEDIKDTAQAAGVEALEEAAFADEMKQMWAAKEEAMVEKKKFYLNRAKKVAAFIKSLDE